MKRTKICPYCTAVLARLDTHIERCRKESPEARVYFAEHIRWPGAAHDTARRDAKRLVPAQEEWLEAAVVAGPAGIRRTLYENGVALRGIMLRGFVEIRDGRVYVTKSGEALWKDRKISARKRA